MFVKICGITDPDDARAAVESGVDAIGLNFSPTSRRQVSVADAAAIIESLPNHVLAVGIFRDHLAGEVLEIAAELDLRAVQLHGSETPATSRHVHESVPVLIRAVPAGDPLLDTIDDHGADVVLLDAPTPGAGVAFDWQLVGDLTRRHRVLLAGGLRPDTVADAIAQVRPWGVDVASGVEASPGRRKDHDAIRAFVDNAREAAALLTDTHPPLAMDRNPA